MNNDDKERIIEQFNRSLAQKKRHGKKTEGAANATFTLNEQVVAEDIWFERHDMDREQIIIILALPTIGMHPYGLSAGLLSYQKPFESGDFDLLENDTFHFEVFYTTQGPAEITSGNVNLEVTDREIKGRITCKLSRDGYELNVAMHFNVRKT
ncbi:hypothetical protein [Pseudomonas grimontii]|uniref:hypothetical protein n=1 Tax=Pseudomonas grimontii TaxID=129847 RepID=UPI00387A8AFA